MDEASKRSLLHLKNMREKRRKADQTETHVIKWIINAVATGLFIYLFIILVPTKHHKAHRALAQARKRSLRTKLLHMQTVFPKDITNLFSLSALT